MNHKIITKLLCCALLAACIPVVNVPDTVSAAGTARKVEYLKRGGYAALLDKKKGGGVYISWRLLGTEPIDQKFDVYRNGSRIAKNIDATNYTDSKGTSSDTYRVELAGENSAEPENFGVISDYSIQNSTGNQQSYIDMFLDVPDGEESSYTYSVQNASVADVDGDGEYEYIINWDPDNRKDNSEAGYTGNVYIDCYELDGTRKWRIDLGKNIRAGSHYTQFIVYDFNGDGRAEMALRTAPGSMDSTGAYVSEKGAPINGEELTWEDAATGKAYTNTDDMRDSTGRIINGPDWLTMFDGATGRALQTVNYYPQRGDVNSWGDDYGNRSERYNACAAYLDGVKPSLVVSRGYYARAAMAAYDWDGSSFKLLWTRDDIGALDTTTNKRTMNHTLYGNGNHQISVCDADNDGRDDIVFGSTVVRYDGEILNSTDHGHGDALHVSDFDNDGEQEIFSVHEEEIGFKEFGAELRKAKNAQIITKQAAAEDNGRGLMGNFDDSTTGSEFFSAIDKNLYDIQGNQSGTNINTGTQGPLVNPSFLVWWDGDLEREILRGNKVFKYTKNDTDSMGSLEQVFAFSNAVSVSKDAPVLQADLFGDWREEVCYPTSDGTALRIFFTTHSTDYKMPTLMHDTQYRTAVAWQNVGYNQPPHPKFFVGKDALNGKYLAPATGFDIVEMVEPQALPQYTVAINSTGDITGTVHTYSDVPQFSDLEYTFPRYILSGTTAFEASANASGSYYGGSITSITENKNIQITYTKKADNVVFVDDLDGTTEKEAKGRASNGSASNKQYTSRYKLEPGNKYKILVYYRNAGRGTQLVADGKTLLTISGSDAGSSENKILTWDFTKITAAGESSGLSYSGGTFGASYYEIDKNGGKLEFTPTDAGTLEITASYTGGGDKAGAIIVDMDGNKNTDDDVTFNASNGINTIRLKAGVKYYIYGPNSGKARISSITFTPDVPVVTGAARSGYWGECTISGVTVENESSIYTVAGSAGTCDPIDTILVIQEESEMETILGKTAGGTTSTAASGKTLQQMVDIASGETEKSVEITSAANQGKVKIPSDVKIVISKPNALKGTRLEAADDEINVELIGTDNAKTIVTGPSVSFGAEGKITGTGDGTTMSTSYSENEKNYKDIGFFTIKEIINSEPLVWIITRSSDNKRAEIESSTVFSGNCSVAAGIFVRKLPEDITLSIE